MDAIKEEIPIIGISPRNSYYSKDNIAFAIAEVVREFGKAYVFIPGLLDRHNYVAYGCSEENARKKASSLGDELRHAVREVCGNGIDRNPDLAQVRIIDWGEEIEGRSIYKQKLADVMRLYKFNPDFRRDIRAATLTSLQTRMDSNSETRRRIQKAGIDLAIDRAANYILGEFAFLEAAPALFEGKHVTYFYHRAWDVFQNYIRGDYGCERPAQSFRIINHKTIDKK